MPRTEVEPGIGAFSVPRGTEAAVVERQRQLNSRSVEPLSDLVKRAADANPVYVFSVGPWPQKAELGSTGNFFVKACPAGDPYSEPLMIPGLVEEFYPDSEVTMKRHLWEGKYLAEQILGIGPHSAPGNSLVRYGVAMSMCWPPKQETVDAARKALFDGEIRSLIVEADQAQAEGPKALEQTVRERHHMAAKLAKLSAADHPWMQRLSSAAERDSCRFCGEPMKKGLPKCPNCKEIVDQALYDQMTGKKPAKSTD